MADDLAALVADERYSPPPPHDPPRPLPAERREPLRQIIAALARALDQDDIARHTRRRAEATQRYAMSHPREGMAA